MHIITGLKLSNAKHFQIQQQKQSIEHNIALLCIHEYGTLKCCCWNISSNGYTTHRLRHSYLQQYTTNGLRRQLHCNAQAHSLEAIQAWWHSGQRQHNTAVLQAHLLKHHNNQLYSTQRFSSINTNADRCTYRVNWHTCQVHAAHSVLCFCSYINNETQQQITWLI